nr:tyrosine-type recombinase/integrase [Bryobacterales bacterium]
MGETGLTAALIRSYLAYCRVDKGLSANTIASYTLDLDRFDQYLRAKSGPGPGTSPDGGTVDWRSSDTVSRYVDHLYQSGLSSRTIARHITTLRNFFLHQLREGRMDQDPMALLPNPKPWQSLPKLLSRDDLARLLEAPDTSTAAGVRDRAMIETLYATGLRVTELCTLEVLSVDLNLGLATVNGKGNRQRVAPMGAMALLWVQRYLDEARAGLLKGKLSKYLFVT